MRLGPASFLLLSCLAAIAFCPAPGIGAETWKATGLLGKSKRLDDSKPKPDATDISGIACATASGYPRVCLVVDDETRWVQIAILKDGRLIGGDRIHLNDDSHDGKAVELDGEAVAYDEGAFYIAGSHGRPRHEGDEPEAAKDDAQARSSRQLFRVQLPEVDLETGKLKGAPKVSAPSTRLSDILKTNDATKAAYDSRLPDGGLSVEGIAVSKRRMFVGLRQPVGRQGATLLSVEVASLFDGKAADVVVDSVDLGQARDGAARGVRDLVTSGGSLLILAGPAHDPPKGQPVRAGDYAIYRYVAGNKPTRLADIDAYGAKEKPEALLPLREKDGRLKALVLFDGPAQGAPREVSFAYP